MKRDLSMYLFWTLSCLWDCPLVAIHAAALWKLQTPPNPQRFTAKVLIISREKRTRTTKEEEIGAATGKVVVVGGGKIVFPSAGVLINIVIVQLQKGGGVSRSAVIDFERMLFHLFFWMN